MSRIGKQIFQIPSGVQVSFETPTLTIKGPKGELKRNVRDEIEVVIKDGSVSVNPVAKTKLAKSLYGTYASHINNMIKGVTEGYTKSLEVHGVGYRAEMQGDKLSLKVGFSHPVLLDIPNGLKVTVSKDNVITVEGFDKEAVGSFAAIVRQVKKPEPYKGKGVRYAGEQIKLKQGKKTN